jgi:activating signal cointegrator complex subunit 1
MSFARDDEALNRAVELLRGMRPRELLKDAVEAARAADEAGRAGVVAQLTAVGGASTVMPPASDDAAPGLAPPPPTSPSAPSFAISLRGLRAMGDRPERTSVLYAAPSDAHGVLQRFCESVRAVFSAADLVVPETRPLLLHATLVNTVYIRDKKSALAAQGSSSSSSSAANRGRGGGRHGRRKAKLEFDATTLMQRHADRVWLDALPLDRLAICRMGAKTVVRAGTAPGDEDEEDAEYEVEAEIEF